MAGVTIWRRQLLFLLVTECGSAPQNLANPIKNQRPWDPFPHGSSHPRINVELVLHSICGISNPRGADLSTATDVDDRSARRVHRFRGLDKAEIILHVCAPSCHLMNIFLTVVREWEREKEAQAQRMVTSRGRPKVSAGDPMYNSMR